ncbi:hypothetical protein NQZ68_010983 [Dissostichus eleginoides]|nr:hypothetical protein NQZ68_010983 [Dissostichus eleginoides]
MSAPISLHPQQREAEGDGTKTGEFTEALPRLEALDVSHLVSEDRRAKDSVQSCCCEHATVNASDLLVEVYVCNTLRNRTMK